MGSTVREFDLVIFGASGFTGKHVVRYMTNISEEETDLKWAVAGRRKKKLRDILQEMSAITGKDLTEIQIIEAEVNDDLSLAEMCRRTKIVLNCVGPYVIYGESVIKACIQNGSHHVDITAESLFAGSMQLKYHEASQQAKVYVIGTSGFDSIPCETGIQYLQEKFNGEVHSVETILRVDFGPFKTVANVGTLESFVLHFRSERERQDLRSRLFLDPIPQSKYPLRSRGLVSYSEEIQQWCVPFPNTDVDVVERTQYYNYHARKMKPVQMMSYLVIPSNRVYALICALGLKLFVPVAKSKLGGYLLKTFPLLMTCGIFSKSGPKMKHIEEASFDMFIIGKGEQSEETFTELNEHSHPPDKKMVVKIHGPEPGYTLTPMIMVQVALVILRESEKLPDEGGVFTPGAAFHHTTLRERLVKNGMTYEVISP